MNSDIVFFDMLEDKVSFVASLTSGEAKRSAINSIVAHPSRKLICTGHEDGSIKIYDFEADKIIQNLANVHSDSVSCLAISNTELQLISGSHDGSIKVWDLRKFSSTKELTQDDFKPLYEI